MEQELQRLGATSEECLSFPVWEPMVAMTEIDIEKSEKDGVIDESALFRGDRFKQKFRQASDSASPLPPPLPLKLSFSFLLNWECCRETEVDDTSCAAKHLTSFAAPLRFSLRIVFP